MLGDLEHCVLAFDSGNYLPYSFVVADVSYSSNQSASTQVGFSIDVLMPTPSTATSQSMVIGGSTPIVFDT